MKFPKVLVNDKQQLNAVSMNKSTEQLLEEIKPPEVRLKQLSDISNDVNVDSNVPILRYYRSGEQLVRMAEVYLKENNYERAYVLLLRFMTLFLEKIPKRPEIKSVPASLVNANRRKVAEVMPVAERLKKLLFNIYTKEYNEYKMRKEYQEQLEQKRRLEAESQKTKLAGEKSKRSADAAVSQIENSIMPVLRLSHDTTLYNILPERESDSSTPPDCSVYSKSLPFVDRSTKPNDRMQHQCMFSVLRSVIVPSSMMKEFLIHAQRNTDRNIETCGILAGKLEKNRFIITHLLIPKQRGTSDSCTTDNEEELFSFQDKHSLITLGWIHVSYVPTRVQSTLLEVSKSTALKIIINGYLNGEIKNPAEASLAVKDCGEFTETENQFFNEYSMKGYDISCKLPGYKHWCKIQDIAETSKPQPEIDSTDILHSIMEMMCSCSPNCEYHIYPHGSYSNNVKQFEKFWTDSQNNPLKIHVAQLWARRGDYRKAIGVIDRTSRTQRFKMFYFATAEDEPKTYDLVRDYIANGKEGMNKSGNVNFPRFNYKRYDSLYQLYHDVSLPGVKE